MAYFSTKRISLIAIEQDHIHLIADWINDENINDTSGARFPISRSEQNKCMKEPFRPQTRKNY